MKRTYTGWTNSDRMFNGDRYNFASVNWCPDARHRMCIRDKRCYRCAPDCEMANARFLRISYIKWTNMSDKQKARANAKIEKILAEFLKQCKPIKITTER